MKKPSRCEARGLFYQCVMGSATSVSRTKRRKEKPLRPILIQNNKFFLLESLTIIHRPQEYTKNLREADHARAANPRKS